MVSVMVGGEGIARLRMAASPAVETLAWLWLTARGARHREFGDPGPAARFALRDRDVALLGKAVRAAARYSPDLLTPSPSMLGWDEDRHHQLERIRATPAGVAVEQLLDPRLGDQSREVRDALDDGSFARRAADGLHRFYDTVLAEQITGIRDALDAELAARGRLMARYGIGHALNTLHPSVRWTGTRIELTVSWKQDYELPRSGLVFVPTMLGCPTLAVQLDDLDNAAVEYPLWGRLAPSARSAGLIQLVGVRRAAILRDLDEPRSTTELGRRHGLSKSTVSHHLNALYRAGLLARVRKGKVVQYSRNHDGEHAVAPSALR